MKVAVLHAPMDLRLDEVPTPEVGPDDLLIKVSAAGICGTDLHFRHMGPRFPEKPMPLGHEYAGEVIEVGANVREFSVGDRVAYNSNNSPADMGRGGECGGFSNFVILRGVEFENLLYCHLRDRGVHCYVDFPCFFSAFRGDMMCHRFFICLPPFISFMSL